jgi:uncharacterized membrane protein YphA (DoxX/SURF4 family)
MIPAVVTSADPSRPDTRADLALALRVGLGLVFVIGGLAKLERLLTPSKAPAIVAEYVGPLGYINTTFLTWLFDGPLGLVLTPWLFLTKLSALELVCGLMLIVGLMVRPLALFWAFLLWSFVFSLPVVTTPGVDLGGVATYRSPAEFVQIRDIALSGMFFALYRLGAGSRSVDADVYGLPAARNDAYDPIGLLLRLSLGAVFLVGGFFAGHDKIVTYGMPGPLLAVIGIGLVAGVRVRLFAAAAVAVLVWFMLVKLGGATSVLGYTNGIKREAGLLAAAGVLAAVGGGRLFTVDLVPAALAAWWQVYTGGRRLRPAA